MCQIYKAVKIRMEKLFPEKVISEDIMSNIIEEEYNNMKKNDIWFNSKWKYIKDLKSDYVGRIGEKFIQKCCDISNIKCDINGVGNKGCFYDGYIKDKKVEIKTASMGCKTNSFQHEMGEKPWTSDYIIFVDISPEVFYLTIFKNYTEEHYKSRNKCIPHFPTKKITWRKNIGAFKLDTTVKINEINVQNKFTYKSKLDDMNEIGKYINNIIN